MANPKHLKLLEQGIEVWNRWRNQSFDVIPDLDKANLHGSYLPGCILSHASLCGACLSNTYLSRADLRRADLSGADLCGANLSYADLSYADLGGANLSGAYLNFAKIGGAVLAGANLSKARMANTIIGDVDLSEVKNLNEVIHHGPSSVGIDTIYKSRGDIPKEFLRSCGVSDDFITYMRSLATKAIEFYSCFISYSGKDEEFATHLYTHLQKEGVRCWFAPKDLRIGDRFRELIDESIRLYDKLLLVLSEHSVTSRWVEKEVLTALETEEQQKKIVLFPVRLDDSVFEVNSGWAADIKRTRHIGDFREWKNPYSYRRGFERLMRDLKADARQ
jgi:hypothetical protein